MKGPCLHSRDRILFHLHSNMDRFERWTVPIQQYAVINLHSNMDRFERIAITKEMHVEKEIYIPIWIDLKDHFEQFTNCREKLFTFQYG